ncbi:MAG: hypothetical protein HN842_11490 [Gammaproteobacteria bacterium]|nr:hypothetical protein [Gammaproteobacteria bacterium]
MRTHQPQHLQFVDHYLSQQMRGVGVAAEKAGLSKGYGSILLAKPRIQKLLHLRQRELREQQGLKLHQLCAMLMQAYRAAQKAGDSLSMLRATVELAKLTGLDKPNQEAALLDRVKGQRRMDQLHKQLESMTESELLKLADLPDGALPDALH